MEINKSIVHKDLTDSLKGILALMIVFSHLSYVTDIYFFSLMNKLGTTVVAMFFFISGYGLTNSYLTKGALYLDNFFKRRILGVFLPMFFVTVIYLLILFSIHYSFSKNILYDFFAKGITPLPNTWFVFALLYFYIFFYTGFRIFRDKRYSVIFIALLSTIFIILTYNLEYERSWWIQTYAFVSGIAFRNYDNEWTKFFRKPLAIIGSFMFVVFMISLHNPKMLVFPYFIIPIVVLSILSYLPFPFKNKFLDFMGNISFEIYLIHGAVIALLNNTFLYQNLYFFSLVVIILSIVLAYLFHIFWNRKINPLLNP